MELSTYFLFGCMWVMTLEWLTTNNQHMEEEDASWGWRERGMNFLLWPVTFCLFIYRIIDELMNNDNNNLGL